MRSLIGTFCTCMAFVRRILTYSCTYVVFLILSRRALSCLTSSTIFSDISLMLIWFLSTRYEYSDLLFCSFTLLNSYNCFLNRLWDSSTDFLLLSLDSSIPLSSISLSFLIYTFSSSCSFLRASLFAASWSRRRLRSRWCSTRRRVAARRNSSMCLSCDSLKTDFYR